MLRLWVQGVHILFRLWVRGCGWIVWAACARVFWLVHAVEGRSHPCWPATSQQSQHSPPSLAPPRPNLPAVPAPSHSFSLSLSHSLRASSPAKVPRAEHPEVGVTREQIQVKYVLRGGWRRGGGGGTGVGRWNFRSNTPCRADGGRGEGGRQVEVQGRDALRGRWSSPQVLVLQRRRRGVVRGLQGEGRVAHHA